MGGLRKSVQLQKKPVVWSKLLNHTKNRTPGMCLATCLSIGVTSFSTSGKFRPVWDFTKLYARPLATRSYALLNYVIIM